MNSTKEARTTQRFATEIHGSIFPLGNDGQPTEPLKAHFVSFSAAGCAIRTSVRLDETREHLIEVPLGHSVGAHETLRMHVEVVWGRDDFRIDTFHTYGLRFKEAIDEMKIRAVGETTEKISDVSQSSLDTTDLDKVVA